MASVAATLIWEQSKLPSQDIYIKVPATYADYIACNPDAFLVACALPAMYYGEQRISVAGQVCPELQQGLAVALHWIHYWFKVGNPDLRIETETRCQTAGESPARTASFFTGGVDSWANLLVNHSAYAPEHPRFIRDFFMVYGLQRVKQDSFERAVAEMTQLGPQFQARFIPVYTNIYSHLMEADTGYRFWKDAYNGAALSAIAHAFSNRYSNVSIASGNDIPNLVPLGSHPAVDPYFSSFNLKISHDCLTYSRFEKTRLIVESELALMHLRVCDMPKIPAGFHNCGQCEKCIRTATTLEAIGALRHSQAFPYQRLTPRLLARACHIKHSGIAAIYWQLIPRLQAQGRADLATVLESKLRRFRLEAVDRAYLNGTVFAALRQVKALLKPSEPATVERAMSYSRSR